MTLVATRAGMRSVDLGWPLVWVHQDQSSLDPPLPHSMALVSPWEDPASIAWAALVVNVLIVFTVVVVGGLLLRFLVVALTRRLRAHS